MNTRIILVAMIRRVVGRILEGPGGLDACDGLEVLFLCTGFAETLVIMN